MKKQTTILTTSVKTLAYCSTPLAAALLALAVVAAPAPAALMVNSVVEDPGNIQNVPGIDSSLTGATMAGAKISVGQNSGLMETVTWNATGAASGEAVGAMLGWRLSLAGESGGNPLVFQGLGTNGIDWIEIDLMPDRQIGAFDDHDPNPGTPGSVGGTDPWLGLIAAGSNSTLGWDIDVTYRDIVALNANSPEKDLYRGLRIDFTRTFVSDDVLSYVADSDAVRNIPEPASFLILGLTAMIAGCSRIRLGR
ncbi:MAG: hypothetical protein MK161_10375 [Pirellulales bacterium]|nr:hypothetical protein [Pirellulales bacterium]